MVFKSILVPIDLAKPASWRFALPQALDLAKAARGTVTVITIIRDLDAMFEGVYLTFQLEAMVAEARDRLEHIAAEHATEGVPVHCEVRTGSIGREILAAARERGTDLIVMASHRPARRDYVIGANAGFVAQHAGCSVLVLRSFDAGDAHVQMT